MLVLPTALTVDLSQLERGYFGFRYDMAVLRLFCASFLLCPLLSAAPASDVVNERIPVRRAELEAHWKIDCLSLWSALKARNHPQTEQGACRVDLETRRTLELCVFVHQPPGGADSGACPDYRSALQELDVADPADQCAVLAAYMADQPSCHRLLPSE